MLSRNYFLKYIGLFLVKKGSYIYDISQSKDMENLEKDVEKNMVDD